MEQATAIAIAMSSFRQETSSMDFCLLPSIPTLFNNSPVTNIIGMGIKALEIFKIEWC